MGITVSPASPAPTQTPFVYDYGYFKSTERLSDLEILGFAYRDYQSFRDGAGSIGGLGLKRDTSQPYPKKSYIFRKIAEMFWGEENKKRHFKWHPWAEKMNERVHEHPVTGQLHPNLALNGCGSSGKSDFLAIYAIINWFVDPQNTLILTTTTDLNAGSRRIWGAIQKYFNAMPGLPGQLVGSLYRINSVESNGKRASGQCGIILVPGEQKKEKECLEKLIGAKSGKVLIVIADELPDLVMAILETYFSNLITGAPRTQLVAAGNFKSRYDPFGVMCKPKDGWESLTLDSEEWDTEIILPNTESRISGYCVRFDGTKSPNILLGRDVFPIYGLKDFKGHKDLGEKSAQFWRFCRSFETPVGIERTLYTESDLRAGKAYETIVWLNSKIPVSGIDPAIKAGGDRCVQYFGWYGQDVDSRWVLQVDSCKVLREDVTRQNEPFDLQIAIQAIENCKAFGVLPEHFGVDATGATAGVYSHIWEKWSPKVLRVEFGGAPSDVPVIFNDMLTGRDRYDRRVSELWGVGKEFMKFGQLKGIDDDLAREMKSREFEDMKRVTAVAVKVETKDAMKTRIGFSPDKADAYFVMLDLCRQRLGFRAAGEGVGYAKAKASWKEQVEKNNLVYVNATYAPEEFAQVI